MHYSLVKLMPNENMGADALDDVIQSLFHALTRLGYEAEIGLNEVNLHCCNIIFGSSNAPQAATKSFPPDSIVFNLEQFTHGSPWVNTAYIRHLANFAVWDYSPRNAAFLREKLGLPKVRVVRLGYVPEMTRLRNDITQDVDVLFYGALNERRQIIVDRLKAAGANIRVLQGVFGAERDAWIERAKIVLNIHYYTPGILEMARLGYLWANKKTVVSELRPDTECYPELAGACRFSDYDGLVNAVLELLADEKAREEQAEAGFRAFSSMPFTDSLRPLIGERKARG